MKIKKHGLLDNPVSDDMRYSENRRYLLDSFKKKQNFRVSYGIGKWFYYRDFSMKIKLRQVMDDEIVIEFDSTTYERELGVKWEEMNEIEKRLNLFVSILIFKLASFILIDSSRVE